MHRCASAVSALCKLAFGVLSSLVLAGDVAVLLARLSGLLLAARSAGVLVSDEMARRGLIRGVVRPCWPVVLCGLWRAQGPLFRSELEGSKFGVRACARVLW